MRIPYISLIAAGALTLGGCAYGDLGYGVGYGGGYGYGGYGYNSYDYASPYYGGYGSPYYGWYDDYIIRALALTFTTLIAGRTPGAVASVRTGCRIRVLERANRRTGPGSATAPRRPAGP
jgi:hypothetical protein